MISFLVLPSLVRWAAWALVRGSWARRVMAIVHSAELACRSPPRLSRRRICLPEEASTGLAPHSAAKLASVRTRPGLSPAVASRAAATWGSYPFLGQELFGGGVTHEFVQCGIQPGDLNGELLVAVGHAGHRGLGALGRAGRVAGAEPGCQLHPPRTGQPGQLLAHLLRCGEDQVAQLVAGWVRALTAPARATRSARMDSAAPSRLFGTPAASPLRAATAAATASAASDLPRWRRACRLGRITSATSTPRPAR